MIVDGPASLSTSARGDRPPLAGVRTVQPTRTMSQPHMVSPANVRSDAVECTSLLAVVLQSIVKGEVRRARLDMEELAPKVAKLADDLRLLDMAVYARPTGGLLTMLLCPQTRASARTAVKDLLAARGTR